MSVRPGPVALALSCVYGAFGLLNFLFFAFSKSEYLTLPFGFVAPPLLYLNQNLKLPRTSSLAYSAFYAVAEVLAYAATGLITGASGVLCLNFVAKKMGGIPARFVTTVVEDGTEQQRF